MRRILAGLLLALATPVQADTLIDNVDGLTLDDQGAVVRFNGVLVADDGRIEQVLRRGEQRPGKVDYRLDGKGRVLVPGMIDAHVRLMDLGLSLITPGGRPPSEPRPEDRDLALSKAQQWLLARGITAVADMGTTIEDWQSYRRAGDRGGLNLRIAAYAADIAAMELIGGPGPSPWLYDDRLRINGVRIRLDGAIDARAGMLKAPYADAPTRSGTPLMNDTQLRNTMSRAAIDNFQTVVEAHGDKAIASVLAAIDELAETYKGERRWRIEGAELFDPADGAGLAKHGVAVTIRPLALSADRLVADARLGAERAAQLHAWNALAQAGGRLAFGSGAPDATPAPFAAMAAAITRQDADGQPFGSWQAQQRLTREAALSAQTSTAAYVLFAEGRFGRIVRGQRADFVLVDRDPMLATPDELRGTRVLQTWVGGKLAWEAKEAAPAD